ITWWAYNWHEFCRKTFQSLYGQYSDIYGLGDMGDNVNNKLTLLQITKKIPQILDEKLTLEERAPIEKDIFDQIVKSANNGELAEKSKIKRTHYWSILTTTLRECIKPYKQTKGRSVLLDGARAMALDFCNLINEKRAEKKQEQIQLAQISGWNEQHLEQFMKVFSELYTIYLQDNSILVNTDARISCAKRLQKISMVLQENAVSGKKRKRREVASDEGSHKKRSKLFSLKCDE
ncbi:MAG TPA: hypothetical protein VEK38_04275, partial [Candidatus Bathyarchaeia archaeon]|nr:hypothetical protein [Candidatus Bathyarchaeia archaeon]